MPGYARNCEPAAAPIQHWPPSSSPGSPQATRTGLAAATCPSTTTWTRFWPARTICAPAISYAAGQDPTVVTGPLRLGLDATQRGRRHEHQPPRGAQPGTRAGCSPARCTSGVSAVISSVAARQCRHLVISTPMPPINVACTIVLAGPYPSKSSRYPAMSRSLTWVCSAIDRKRASRSGSGPVRRGNQLRPGDDRIGERRGGDRCGQAAGDHRLRPSGPAGICPPLGISQVPLQFLPVSARTLLFVREIFKKDDEIALNCVASGW
jgi:hypothetical protein